MDYGLFKGLQALLFFGAAFGFGIWQLIALERDRPESGNDKQNDGEDTTNDDLS
ncbi:MAG: hypothetical protein AAF756_03995 [Pseudomonadota bacterium]